MPRAIVCVTNDLSTDNRVHRTCTVLQELGYEVLLVGRQLPGSRASGRQDLPLERPYATQTCAGSLAEDPAPQPGNYPDHPTASNVSNLFSTRSYSPILG